MAGRSGDEHLEDWAALHLTEAPRGFVGGWLRGIAAVARPVAARGISPNVITVWACLAAVSAVPLATIHGWPGPALACAAVVKSGLLDALDGAVAIQSGRATRVGFLLDSTLDRLADAALPVAVAVVAFHHAGGNTGAGLEVGLTAAAVATCWWLEYVRARASLAAPTAAGEAQLITPGERPTRIILAAVGLGIPPLALASLWAQAVIVGGSALLLFVHSLARLRRLDQLDRAAPAPPAVADRSASAVTPPTTRCGGSPGPTA